MSFDTSNRSSTFIQNHPLGHVFESHVITVFFGNRLSTRDRVEAAFPDYALNILKQTHSDVILASPAHAAFGEEAAAADAHFTQQRRQALCIRTADCVPVFIHDPVTQTIAAIHAGWRGIENEIIRKTCRSLREAGCSLENAYAWIGPHIGAESFEVDRDVALSLEARFDAVRGSSRESTSLRPHPEPTKAFVSLITIARAQLASEGIERERVLELPLDTVQSADHESYRRDRGLAGRQISFIALK